MFGLCGAECKGCECLNKTCEGCEKSKGCPFGKKCWIYQYIEMGGKEGFGSFKNQLIDEFYSLEIDGLSNIDDLYPLHGSFVNLEYTLPNGEKVKYLKDDELYLGNQIECPFNDDIKRCFGIVANTNFLLVCEYGEDGSNPELIIYKKR